MGQTRHYCNPPTATTNTYHYQAHHHCHHLLWWVAPMVVVAVYVSWGQTRHYHNPPPAITNTHHYQPTHLSHHPPLPPPTMMNCGNGWCQWLVVEGGGRWHFIAPVGGAVEKFTIFFNPNELKSPKNNMSFYYFFLIRVGGWMGQIPNRKFY